MDQWIVSLTGNSGFLPHGYCFRWDPLLLWTLITSHLVIGLSYFSIPIALVYFVRRQKNLKFNWVFLMFGLFIMACGTSHFVSLANIWLPAYRLDAAVLAVTAGISLATAILLWPLVPEASAFLNSRALAQKNLEEANRHLGESMELLERQRAEAEKNERRFRLTFENAPIGLAIVGTDGRWIEVNQTLCSILGYSESELLTKTFQDLTHPEDLAADLAKVSELLEGRRDSYRMEKRYFHKLGREVCVQLDVVLMRSQNGQPLHFISQIMDISQRKLAEFQLGESRNQLEAGYAQLKTQNHEVTMLGEPSAALQACNNVGEMKAPIREYTQALFPACSGVLYLMHASRNYLESVVSFGTPDATLQTFDPHTCWSLRRSEPHWLGKAGLRCGHIHADAAGPAILCTPVLAFGSVIGLSYLQSNQPVAEQVFRETRQHLEQLAGMLADRIGIAIANVNLRETLRLQSIRDPMTGLLNRRYLEESLPRELDLAAREGHSLALMMIDVDHFKRFNDTHGHDAGDKALKHVARQLEDHFRTTDVVCRFGGEEFAIVVPRACLKDAREKAELLCARLRQLTVDYHGSTLGNVTVSIGIACYPEHGDKMELLIEMADKAMYKAKRAGRDRVCCSDARPEQALV